MRAENDDRLGRGWRSLPRRGPPPPALSSGTMDDANPVTSPRPRPTDGHGATLNGGRSFDEGVFVSDDVLTAWSAPLSPLAREDAMPTPAAKGRRFFREAQHRKRRGPSRPVHAFPGPHSPDAIRRDVPDTAPYLRHSRAPMPPTDLPDHPPPPAWTQRAHPWDHLAESPGDGEAQRHEQQSSVHRGGHRERPTPERQACGGSDFAMGTGPDRGAPPGWPFHHSDGVGGDLPFRVPPVYRHHRNTQHETCGANCNSARYAAHAHDAGPAPPGAGTAPHGYPGPRVPLRVRRRGPDGRHVADEDEEERAGDWTSAQAWHRRFGHGMFRFGHTDGGGGIERDDGEPALPRAAGRRGVPKGPDPSVADGRPSPLAESPEEHFWLPEPCALFGLGGMIGMPYVVTILASDASAVDACGYGDHRGEASDGNGSSTLWSNAMGDPRIRELGPNEDVDDSDDDDKDRAPAPSGIDRGKIGRDGIQGTNALDTGCSATRPLPKDGDAVNYKVTIGDCPLGVNRSTSFGKPVARDAGAGRGDPIGREGNGAHPSVKSKGHDERPRSPIASPRSVSDVDRHPECRASRPKASSGEGGGGGGPTRTDHKKNQAPKLLDEEVPSIGDACLLPERTHLRSSALAARGFLIDID